eukprot:TRINITY_DN254_c0_g3_i2.p1 TRINITY_DN254_c0_g3~~TRINITY_DN254_c0_g3_i2.p1  ORF type:complete len:655 (+),score=174.24 TRINITY_DN254_c0_g3_i2:84-2048(+)
MQQRRSLDGFGMEKRSHGFTRPSEDEADGEAPSLFGKTGSPNTSPTSSPIRRTAEAAASAVPSGLAVVKPIVAAIIIYMTVLVHVIHLWGERTSNFDDAMPVLPAQEVAASAKSIKTPLASEARSTAPDSVPVIQSGRKLELLGKLLRASWLWAKAGDPGVIGDQRQHQPVSGLSAEELRFRAVELQQPDVFQLIMRDGSRVQAKDCHLLSRSVADMQQLQLPALSAGGANTALSGETLALRCPQDIDVRWSVGLLQLPTGAEVLRQTMRFDRSSPKNRGQAHGVSRLVLWSLRTPGCAAFADSSAREAPLHKAQAAACFAPAPVLAFRGKQLVNSSSQDIVDGSPLVSVSAGAWLSLEHPRSTYAEEMVAASQLASGLFVAIAASVASASHLRVFHDDGHVLEKSSGSLIRPLEYSHKLRVCNAFPLNSGLDVFKGETEKLTKDAPMPYKACQEFANTLKSGDKLEFKVGDTSTGSFAISTLPDNDATLLLIVHRHDTKSTAVSFESHIFGNLQSPQVAVIDTYKGKKQANLKIRDEEPLNKKDKKAKKKQQHKRTEELRFNNVVAVDQGKYDVELDDEEGSGVSKSSFVALDRQSYVVMRVGVEGQNGDEFPEEVVVFPQSDPHALPHSAAAKGGALAAFTATAAAVFATML